VVEAARLCAGCESGHPGREARLELSLPVGTARVTVLAFLGWLVLQFRGSRLRA
jgi:hypothetical protein